VAIPESQLETWSHQGSITQSSTTYGTIGDALRSEKAIYKDTNYEAFLQGSYGNDTNIYSESDVDVVMRLDSILRSDVSALPADQQAAYHAVYSPATYHFAKFYDGVVLRLNKAFPGFVTPGNKAIRIAAGGGRRDADVVVCYQYRRYSHFLSDQYSAYTQGIIFQSQSSGTIINFPKLHSAELTQKHQSTNSWFKPTVRIFKNVRSRLVEQGKIQKGTAPSYYLEGLLHNVPVSEFGGNYSKTFCSCFDWIVSAERSRFLCAHQQYPLLGNSNVQWNANDCELFLKATYQLWSNWNGR